MKKKNVRKVKSATNNSIKSKARVEAVGEVFTPLHIVNKMLDEFPPHCFSDPTFIWLEPTCGNGNFIVEIIRRKIAAGLTIEQALNTTWGMDIMDDNIEDCHKRILKMIKEEYLIILTKGKGSRFKKIVENNIFKVKDSLEEMKSGSFTSKKFVFDDPTGCTGTLN